MRARWSALARQCTSVGRRGAPRPGASHAVLSLEPDESSTANPERPEDAAVEDLRLQNGQAGAGEPEIVARSPRSSAEPGEELPEPTVYADLIAPERVDADAVKVLRRLTRSGYAAFLVGGGVRDLLLGRQPKDFDIATSARPNEVKREFRNCRIIGRRFRLAHILFAGGKVIEVATFRRDPDQEGFVASEVSEDDDEIASLRPAPKERGDDQDLLIRQDNTFGEPHEDAIRRDFTINGLFYDLERREVIDYVGGVRDLRDAVVRTIGDPDVRFREDPVRILRAIKFSARLDFGIAPEVYDAIVDVRGELSRSAPPRVLEEILRLLRGGAAQRSVFLMWDTGVLGLVLPELSAHLEDEAEGAEEVWTRLSIIDRMQAASDLPSDTVLIAALLYGPLAEAVEGTRDPARAFDDFFAEMAVRLALPRRLRDRMRLIYAAQRRLDRGQVSGLDKREIWGDTVRLYAIRALATGRTLPQWAEAAMPRAPSERAQQPRAAGPGRAGPSVESRGGPSRRRRSRR
jgi:poly(A) polymerase